MAKVQLGKRPTVIPHTVKFTDIDGTKLEIRVKYKYRDRKELSALIDKLMADQKSEVEAQVAGAAMTLEQGSVKAAEARAHHILEILEEWDVEPADLTLDNLVAFSLQYPGASDKLVFDYAAAINEGRLGN